MNEIQDGIDAPLNIQGGLHAIPLYLASMDSRMYELGEEIVFKDDIIQDFVTLDRIQKMSENRFAVDGGDAAGTGDGCRPSGSGICTGPLVSLN